MISRHLSVVTFAIFTSYAYRDVWPLMTFTLRPADEAEGVLLWAKVALSAFAGLVEPVFEPYPFMPLNPNVRSIDHDMHFSTHHLYPAGHTVEAESGTNGIHSVLSVLYVPGSNNMACVSLNAPLI